MLVQLIARWTVPAVLIMMTLGPAAAVVLTGRNLASFDSLEPLEASALAGWVLRLCSLASVAALATAILIGGVLRSTRKTTPWAMLLMIAYLVFFATNVLSPGLFGAVPGIERSFLYMPLLFVAIYVGSSDDPGLSLDAAKWSLLILLLASFALSAVWPGATLRGYAEELRLPLIPFRFWGLGSGPNSIAPLGLILLLLTISRPFGNRFWQWAAWSAAGLTILLAQSQTTWIATAIIVPPMLLYRRHLERHPNQPIRWPPAVALTLIGLGFAAAVALAFHVAGLGHDRVATTGGVQVEGALLTGRSLIWQVAIDTFKANPVFGYGLEAWEHDFRSAIGMSFAVHAHNQLMHALSVGGLVAGAGLIFYVAVLMRTCVIAAPATAGLAPALMLLTLLRMLTEVPLQVQTLLVGEAFMHALLFATIMMAAAEPATEVGTSPGQAPATPQRRRWRVAIRPSLPRSRRRRRTA